MIPLKCLLLWGFFTSSLICFILVWCWTNPEGVDRVQAGGGVRSTEPLLNAWWGNNPEGVAEWQLHTLHIVALSPLRGCWFHIIVKQGLRFAPPPACGRPSPSGFTSQPVAIQDKLQFCKAFLLPKLKKRICWRIFWRTENNFILLSNNPKIQPWANWYHSPQMTWWPG